MREQDNQNIARARAYSEDDEPSGVFGTLKEMPLSEIVQGLTLSKRDALIEVKPKGEPVGVIGVESGRIVYAKTDALAGEPAFFKLFCVHRGVFRIRYGRRADSHNLDREPTWLLLEAAQHLDEERASRPVSDTPAQGLSASLAATAVLHADSLAPARETFSGFFDEAGLKATPG